MQSEKSRFNLNYLREIKSKNVFYTISCLGVSILVYKNTKNYLLNENNKSKHQNETDSIQEHLINKEPKHIEAPNIEQLISLPRFQHVLYLIKQANKYPSKVNNQRVIDELSKLSNLQNNENKDDLTATINIIKNNNKNSLTINKTDTLDTTNHFLNNGIANQISQMLNYDLMFDMAFQAPEIDNRFFRNEIPTIIQKLNQTCPNYNNNNNNENNKTKSTSIYEDIDYALILEFYQKYVNVLLIDSKQNNCFVKNKDLNLLFNKLRNELNSLIISSISDRPKLSVWSTDDSDISYDEYDDSIENNSSKLNEKILESSDKIKNYKEKIKFEFIQRNEALIMNIVELMVHVNTDEFVNMFGMDLLLLLYEKHKYNDNYLIPIGKYNFTEICI